MDFNTGDVVAFVLAVFSTILLIIPMIELPSNDHSSDEIYRLSAVYTIMNSSNPNQLWAYNKLHDPNHVGYVYKKEFATNIEPYYYEDPAKIDANLAMAVANYNNNSPSSEFLTNTEPYLQNLPDGKISSRDSHYNIDNLQKEIWFTKRMAHLETPLFNQTEDANCTRIHLPTKTTVCSHSDLNSTKNNIDDLTQIGFVSNFYNTNERVHAIENPVETYVDYLNHLIIISLITGPITYIATKNYYIKRKEGNG